MATYYCVDARPAAGIPGEVHTSKLNDLGAVREFAVDGVVNSFIYLQGVASTVTGNWVAFDPGTYTTSLLATTSKGQCAIAMGAVVASNYGWYGYIGSCAARLPRQRVAARRPARSIGRSSAATTSRCK